MKRQLTSAFVGFLLLTVSACMPAQMTDSAMQNDSAMSEKPMSDKSTSDKSMDDQSMAKSETMTDTMMADTTSESHAMSDTMVMSDTMMGDSHAMSETETMTSDAMTSDAMASDAMKESTMMELPVWMTLPLTNARTGESMTLSDFKGKTLFVETMATWCPNCRTQLSNVKAAKAQLNDPNVVFIAISVETDLAAEELARYADNNSFDWFFAVSSPELLTELAGAFGQTIANPPATPHFVIQSDGSVGQLVTGIESSEQILASLQ